MKIFIFLNLLVTLTYYASAQLSPSEVLNNHVKLAVYPPFIVNGLPLQVDIECTFKRDSVPSMASVMSMVIAHSNKTNQPDFNYMASVNGMEGHAHNVSHDVEVISGSIDNNGESTLHMRFMYPETNLIGLYMCEVTGFDQIGKPVSIYSTVNIWKSNITDLFDLLHNAQTNVSALQNSINRMQASIDSLQMMNNLLSTLCSDYYPAIFYNGHDYYLSNGLTYFNRTEMQAKCGSLGGYLVELDTHDEFSFIRDYLSKLDVKGAIWTGATDEKQAGVWINEHNSTSKMIFDWAPGQPNGGDCQCFYYDMNLFLADWFCYHYQATLSDDRYICEVPRK